MSQATSGVSLPQPTAVGTLGKTPFPHLLLYLLEKQLTGSIEVTSPSGERATLLVLEGYPSKIRAGDPSRFLWHVLRDAGIVSQEQLDASMQQFTPGAGKLHGQVLVELGMLDMPALLEGLRRQLIEKMQALFVWPAETQYAYYDAFDALANYGADDLVTVDPLPLVWAAVKQSPSWEHVNATLSRIGKAALRLSPTAQLDRFAFTVDERRFVELLRPKPRKLYEMSSAGTLGIQVTQLLLYCLVISRQVDVVADEASPSIAPPPAAAIPVSAPASIPPPSPPRRSANPPSAPAAVARVQLQPRQVPKAGAVEERSAPDVARRDARASDPVVASPSPSSIQVALAEAAKSGPVDAPPSSSRPSPSIPPPPSPRSVPPPSSSNAPPALEPEAAALALADQRKRILQRAEEITSLDYFQMLSVPREAAFEEVQRAYFQLAKVWHPDKLPPTLADVRDACTKVFTHLSEAHQTLTDAKRRAHYMMLVKDGGATPDDQAQIAGILEAATNFQKAEVCLRRNDLVQAEELARAALSADPKQADYITLVAWLEALKPENQSNEATAKRIHMLDQALQLSQRCERAYFYRAMLYKRIGNEREAFRDFKQAADLNPRNIDATREVRLYSMRKGRPSKPPSIAPPGARPPKKDEPAGGLFGKLFKK